MCGFSVLLRTGDSTARPAPLLQRMHDEIAHRGPDGEGWLTIDRDLHAESATADVLSALPIPDDALAAAAFRWLRIQDLDPRSSQPMSTPDRRLWIVFNGEIYNHAALRTELQGAGDVFRTASDTEVALLAWRRWGGEAFARLHGMWGLALFDLDRRELIVSRDRLGIKPLYYARRDRWLMWSSEPRAIALADPRGPRAEPFRTHEFLRGLPPQSAELSFFEGVLPFPAGCWARVPLGATGAGELQPQRYWDLASVVAEPLPESRFEETREAFEQLLVDAVESHTTAAVEVGSMLSGGVDSSLLSRLLSGSALRRGLPPPKAFSIIFEDPAMSEWPYMQMMLAQGGLRGFNHLLSADEAWATTPRAVEAQGQPLLGQDTVAQFHAYRLAREHGAVVVIEGQGADELFAGLPAYDAQQFPAWLQQGHWLRAWQELQIRRRRQRLGWRDAVRVYVAGPLRRQRMEDRGLPRYDWIDARGVDSSLPGVGRSLDGGPRGSALQRFAYRHVRHTNLPAVLMHQDRSSMAHAIESRVPFLDHRIVELAFGLPDSYRISQGLRKRIVLETAKRHLPPAVANRPDKRSFISRAAWMDLATTRAAELREMAGSREIAEFAMLRPQRVRAFVDDFLAGRHRDEMAVWRLYTLWHWLLRFRASLP